ncbi:tetratricopeptide repeat protein [Flavobacterium sp. CGRL2]
MLTSCRKQNVDSSKKINREIEIKEIISKANKFYNNYNNTDSAFFYYNKARVACNLKKDLKSYVSCMYYMAEIQQDHEDFVGSIKTAMETVPLLDELNNSDYIWNIYSVLGRNYYYTYDYPTAIYYYSKAFTLKTNKINKLEAKNNIAVIYIKQQKFDKALPIFVSISNEKIVQQNPENYSKILDYIGYCYYKLKNSKALIFFEMSLKIKSKANYIEGLGRTYYNLAEYYQNDKADLAMKYAKLSYKNYTLSGNTDDRLLALKFIIENSSDIDSKKKCSTLHKSNR